MEKKQTFFEKAKTFGPGILMATAAVGGSHIVSATQAGALYGWQLLILVLLVNLFKYPFLRVGTDYTLTTGRTLVQGYEDLGKGYVIVFYILMIISTIANLAAVAMLSGTLIRFQFPQFSITLWTVIILILGWALNVFGGYSLLTKFSKILMLVLTILTVGAVILSIGTDRSFAEGFVANSPWNFASLPFLISLMGWMPCPIELSVLSSLWTVANAKESDTRVSKKNGLLDFDVSYIVTVGLAVCFLAMGCLIQYGSGNAVEGASAAYINQFVEMYESAFGAWSGNIIAIVAFLCILGTLITVIDGYPRAVTECHVRIFKKTYSKKIFPIIVTTSVALAGLLVVFNASNVAILMKLATILSFVTAPLYSYLNLKVALRTKGMTTSKPLLILSYLGLIFLTGFTVLFIYAMFTGNAGL